jgi:hypothetical protein
MSGCWLRIENGLLYVLRSSYMAVNGLNMSLSVVRSCEMASCELRMAGWTW